MKKVASVRFKKVFIILISCTFLFSCSKENLNSEELTEFNLAYDPSGEDYLGECIYPEGSEFYIKSGHITVNAGRNEKEMVYESYNTSTEFIVKAHYSITEGNSEAKATITIKIADNEKTFNSINSGATVTHSIPLLEGFIGGTQIDYYIKQVSLGDPVEFSGTYNLIPVCEPEPPAIGQKRFGGIIAYIFEEEDPGYIAGETHGLIAALENQSEAIPWSNIAELSEIGTLSKIGTGMKNTEAITNSLGTGDYAAQLCADLTLNGYSDWYLPSRDELEVAIINLPEIFPLFTCSIFDPDCSGPFDQLLTSTEDLNNPDQQSYSWELISPLTLRSKVKTETYIVRAFRTF